MPSKQFLFINKQGDTAEIMVYGYIGDHDDVCAADFVKELRALEKEYRNIHVRINSGGGSVFEGFAIFNAIKNSKANIEGFIDGVCASMGTVIALGCKKIHMSKVARFMTHRASGGAYGSADELRQQAELLEGLENSICSVYAARTGLSVEECRAKYMNGTDRWLTAQQALEERLIDSIYDMDAVNEIELPDNLSEKGAVELFTTSLSNRIENFSNQNSMRQIQLPITASLMATLGIAENADANAVERAITALDNKAKNAEREKAELATKLSDAESKVTELQNAATKDKVNSLLEKALAEKKITNELKATFAEQYATNPAGLEKILNAMPAYQPITSSLNTASSGDKYAGKSWDELNKANLLNSMKQEQPEAFKELYKSTFGRDYPNS